MGEPNPDLQFDRAEFDGTTPTAACGSCQTPLAETYYEVNGVVTCDKCRRRLEQEWSQSTDFSGRLGRFLKAALFGSLAAAAGSAIYFAVAALFSLELSLIAILVGWMVGTAVRKGARGRGGWLYQALAIFLTYTSIVSSFVLHALKEGLWQTLSEQAATPLHLVVGIVVMIPIMYAAPFLAGFENIMGIVIIAIGLYQAWAMNKKASLQVSGPYSLAARAGDPPIAPAPGQP